MDIDDKYIWSNLVESHKPAQLGRITKRLNWVEDAEESHMSDTDYLVPVLHDGSYYHTDSYWDKALDWTKGWVDPDDGEGVHKYILYDHSESGLHPGMIVRRVENGWTLHQIPDDLLEKRFNIRGAPLINSSEQISRMNILGARFLEKSDLEKHGYVEILASSQVASDAMKRLR